jgi:hypothetical protein
MRLGVRAKDCQSFGPIERIFFDSHDSLILSACAFALSSLAECCDDYKARALAAINNAKAKVDEKDLVDLFDKQLIIINSLGNGDG